MAELYFALFSCCLVLVCLPVCGHGRGNGARTPARASASRTRALRSGDTTRNGRFARPCDRSTYTYMSSGRSPARLVSFSRVPPRCGPDRDRAWHLWSSSARCSGSRPLSRSLRRRSRRLRGDTRRNASSADTPPRLATCLAAHPTNRVVACRSVRHSTPRPFLTFRCGAFFFVVSALADVPSASLTLLAAKRC